MIWMIAETLGTKKYEYYLKDLTKLLLYNHHLISDDLKIILYIVQLCTRLRLTAY